ncbi:MAG: hypothetical protein COU98_02305 [Candidatus Staskawiczbacteria bacterium CG10_big_fil_rev_8_21_14_0_10_38_10]|uniref:CMP/dCMP-type deaminase domain-containing protein n=1 Tax=Candidatus Staskawiczbacteria bacterium CG10_big_fil_rev_8_21_14_0_10_38_10 TaxID=1974891 RepID=A0A2H9T116_9BACT|nr:MAG: hypothetical protein COU98_02305 [Candidatus Staskawiczbacteria bacterium CG10_big_fil_rev_8_21_14_0_10_38_10]
MADLQRHKNILIIGEFPVIHKGYINFFNKIRDDIKSGKLQKTHFYLGFLDNRIIEKMTKLEPDIRKIPLNEAKNIIKVFLPIKKIFLLDIKNFSKIILDEINADKIIILKGEKSEDFGNLFLSGKKYKKRIQYYDIRLRWQNTKVVQFKGKKSLLNKKELLTHQKFLNGARKEAENSKCWWRQVGAVLVKNNRIILRSFNKMMPFDDECYKIGCVRDGISPGKSPEICSVAHAEAGIIAAAALKGVSLKNTTLYVTHFPCSACAKLVALAGIKKLVYSKGSAFFDGERVLKKQGIEIIKI